MLKHVEALVERSENAFITVIDGNQFPVVKIVNAPRKRDGVKTLYFTTPHHSKSVAEYAANDKASVYFVDKGRFQTALFVDHMTLETDDTIRKELFEDEQAKIFSKGKDLNDYAVLKFVADNVRFFSNLETTDIAL